MASTLSNERRAQLHPLGTILQKQVGLTAETQVDIPVPEIQTITNVQATMREAASAPIITVLSSPRRVRLAWTPAKTGTCDVQIAGF